MKTEEKNRMIAEFMGMTWVEKGDNDFPSGHFEKGEDWYGIDFVNYHTSWDWLMPVVEKIEAIKVKDGRYSIVIRDNVCSIYHAKAIRPYLIATGNSDTKLSATYTAVCQFIEYYNKNQEK